MPLRTSLHRIIPFSAALPASPCPHGGRTVANREHALAFVDDHLHSESLSKDRLSQLLVLQEISRPNYYHVVLHAAHYITDGMAVFGFRQAFLERLSSPTPVPTWDLTVQLALAVALEDLEPTIRKLNAPRRRWQKAIAFTLASLRMQQKVKDCHF